MESAPGETPEVFYQAFFAGYAAITLLVLISIFISTGNKTNTMSIGHITTISDHNAVERSAQENKVGSTIKKQTDERSR
ncbi:hypothetical protein [Chryseobacterium sp. 18068]|uniref:hypothetical protein n=1 Tax=Chryseobacterium sp. 18068 TaxID=2681414 RepID=UPI00135BEB8C|nr:hypothetical protein [Chryseobacterium sp. 18068]